MMEVSYVIQEVIFTWCWWLMPVIPAIQEAEIGRITVQSLLGQIVCETQSQKKIKHDKEKGWWSGSRCRHQVQTPIPPETTTKESQNL
jgi:hypothetical protein